MSKYFLKQDIMNRVLFSLIPLIIFAVYNFGWRVIPVLLITNLAALITEFLFARKKKAGKVTGAVFVTGTLLALTLPPAVPFWMAALGAVIAITFGKMVFGGFGMNVFNPAIVGRTFLYISFPGAMQQLWTEPTKGFPGGFVQWLNQTMPVTAATPMKLFRDTGNFGSYDLTGMFLGQIPGCIGETSGVLILLAAVYLILRKTAKWQPMVATILGFSVFSLLFYQQNPLPFIVSGGLLFGAVFMVTDPVSMPKGRSIILWIYGLLVGGLTVFIRAMSLFPEGFMFALLLANTFMPIIEYAMKPSKSKKG